MLEAQTQLAFTILSIVSSWYSDRPTLATVRAAFPFHRPFNGYLFLRTDSTVVTSLRRSRSRRPRLWVNRLADDQATHRHRFRNYRPAHDGRLSLAYCSGERRWYTGPPPSLLRSPAVADPPMFARPLPPPRRSNSAASG
jgi:hypothetical protein